MTLVSRELFPSVARRLPLPRLPQPVVSSVSPLSVCPSVLRRVSVGGAALCRVRPARWPERVCACIRSETVGPNGSPTAAKVCERLTALL